MTVTVCDRCGVRVDAKIEPPRSIVIPAGQPSTLPVLEDRSINIGAATPNDLCSLCLVSALVAFVLARSGALLTPDTLRALSLRIAAVTTPTMVTPVVAVPVDVRPDAAPAEAPPS